MNIDSLDDMQIYKKFKDYLVSFGYKEFTPKGLGSTAFDYPKRIRYIVWYENYKSCIDVVRNIKGLLKEYDIGGIREDIGQKSNAAVINALKRFEEFLVYAENYMHIYSSHLIEKIHNIFLIPKENKVKQTNSINIQNINKIFTLFVHDVFGDETMQVYISETEQKFNASKIQPTTTLAKALVNKNIGEVFTINDTEYLVENIEEFEQ